MRKLVSVSILCLFFCVAMMAQAPAEDRPHRTPEEEALTQTTRLVRELNITDSVRFDTIYRMHLKYARIRQKGLSRAENMLRLQNIYDELRLLLTPEEFERFMNQPAERPRRPHGATNVQAPGKPTPHTAPQ
ncbi:MAG: hypothetical protein II605_00655 [Paludibacteraceae bacterium]|nr:hypothetical protein [Paludibacteraceae bacterium]MBQ2190594.1 hypothetical protein [Paludibacteraceae bacterium]MBQ2520405.1 hypothetical protein [Paludibacteraceae bacterium]MBQ4017732.1 hypothetical protein [Paludibacteraceae bacterium]MBQ5378752.1 hypothetical protein [Paludibacteraceae bacterium]